MHQPCPRPPGPVARQDARLPASIGRRVAERVWALAECGVTPVWFALDISSLLLGNLEPDHRSGSRRTKARPYDPRHGRSQPRDFGEECPLQHLGRGASGMAGSRTERATARRVHRAVSCERRCGTPSCSRALARSRRRAHRARMSGCCPRSTRRPSRVPGERRGARSRADARRRTRKLDVPHAPADRPRRSRQLSDLRDGARVDDRQLTAGEGG